MNLVILSANEQRQSYFIERLAAEHTITGIVVDRRYDAADRLRRLWRVSGRNPFTVLHNVVRKCRLRGEERREKAAHGRAFAGFPLPADLTNYNVMVSDDINDRATVSHVAALKPDVVVVFGTRLLKQSLIEAASRTINIHTGLSPYYRGGHSTFFCLYNREPEYIGATVHEIDTGIDSGRILLTGRPPLEATDDLYSIECKVIVLGTDLMLEALRRIDDGVAQGTTQWTEGRLYYSRDFTLARRIELMRRWRAEPPGDALVAASHAEGIRLVT